MVVPLISQGELIGTLNLGPRLSEQEYSTDDRRLLASLATQAAPAVRVAELVVERAGEIQARERLEQEMRVATLIQQQFLPHELPKLDGWQVAAYYGPARAVGGDFYDFIELPDGRIGIVVGDVTDKGVPAALIMARTQSVLRGEAPRSISPGEVLRRANEILLPEMPARMFVTCLYLVLEPATGRVVFANAGHLPPYVRTADGVHELRATGMPLGLLPGMTYDEKEGVIDSRDSVVLYSDGLIEAHGPAGDMFGFPRLRELMAHERPGTELLNHLLEQLHEFVGRGWEQEDDITLVALQRTGGGEHVLLATDDETPSSEAGARRALLTLSLPGESGNERIAMTRVGEAVASLDLPAARLERLKTAVSEATMNAIEYGSQNDPTIPVQIEVWVTDDDLFVSIADRGLSGPIPDAEEPDLEAKLAGDQKPRGWGLFLIKHMVDAMEIVTEGATQTVILTLHLGGVEDASQPI
jgi:serine phosphatase RsbU (regulator of sigma subunit)/anti-sigma regulatory factor (Ser/Thr protein kinase)